MRRRKSRKVTIIDGVGGDKFDRDIGAVEKAQYIAKVEIFSVPLRSGAASHSIVRITYNNYDGHQKSLWVERVGRSCGYNVELTQDTPCAQVGRTLFRVASNIELKCKLSLYTVLEQAVEWGNIPYCIHRNNCHILAVNLFNYCLVPDSEIEIPADQIPDRYVSKLALMFGPFVPVSSIAGSATTGVVTGVVESS